MYRGNNNKKSAALNEAFNGPLNFFDIIYTRNKAAFQLSVVQWYVATMIKVSKTTDSLLKKKYTLLHFLWLGF